MSIWNLSQRTSGYCLAISATRSSHQGMEMEMPLDLVAAVRCLPRLRASSNANFSTRLAPMRVNTLSWMTTSRSVPPKRRPPLLEYSPRHYAMAACHGLQHAYTFGHDFLAYSVPSNNGDLVMCGHVSLFQYIRNQ